MLSEKKGVLDAYSEESFWALSTQYLIPTFSLVYTFTVPPNVGITGGASRPVDGLVMQFWPDIIRYCP
jgi:hypothetical protein